MAHKLNKYWPMFDLSFEHAAKPIWYDHFLSKLVVYFTLICITCGGMMVPQGLLGVVEYTEEEVKKICREQVSKTHPLEAKMFLAAWVADTQK
jgi:hypothetical protein